MLKVIRKKGCRRCRGNLSVECDIYGVYVQCIQCGAQYSEKDLHEMISQDIAEARKARAVPTASAPAPASDPSCGPGERWPRWRTADTAGAPSAT